MEAKAYEDIAAFESEHWWFTGRRAIIDRVLSRLPLPEDPRILEIGCGSGGNLEMLSRYGRVYAGEYNEEALGVAARRGIAKGLAHCALPDVFPFENESFDLIALFDVLEHIDDDRASLLTIHRHLAPTGILVLTVPMFPFLWSGHDVYNHHYRRYTRSELSARLHQAGFETIYESYFNFWLFPVVSLVRGVKNVLGRNDDAGDLSLPPRPLNLALGRLLASEALVMGRVRLPFGVSSIVCATPRSGAPTEDSHGSFAPYSPARPRGRDGWQHRRKRAKHNTWS